MSSPSTAIPKLDGLTVEHHQCITVACTTCDAKLGVDWVLHFGSLAETLATINEQGWEVSPDAVLCEDCVDLRDSHSPNERRVTDKCTFCWPPLFSDAPPPATCQCADPDATLTHHLVVPFINLAHRSVTQHCCVTLRCKECGQAVGEDEEFEPHYPDLQAALDDAATDYAWLITDTKGCCRDCARRRDCLATGHRFAEAPNYITNDGVEVRWCNHCDATVRNLVTDPNQPWL